MKKHRVRIGYGLAALAAVAMLAATFAAYLSPHMAVDLASRVWACF